MYNPQLYVSGTRPIADVPSTATSWGRGCIPCFLHWPIWWQQPILVTGEHAPANTCWACIDKKQPWKYHFLTWNIISCRLCYQPIESQVQLTDNQGPALKTINQYWFWYGNILITQVDWKIRLIGGGAFRVMSNQTNFTGNAKVIWSNFQTVIYTTKLCIRDTFRWILTSVIFLSWFSPHHRYTPQLFYLIVYKQPTIWHRLHNKN